MLINIKFLITGTNINQYKCSLKEDSKSEQFLENAICILNSMRYQSKQFSNSLPCLIGWRNNVKCLLSLSKHLRSTYNVHSIDMHNCSQDCVENFFSRMRSGGGNRDNPSAGEFLAEYRKITVDSLFDQVRGSNCKLDAGEFLLKLTQLQECIPTSISPTLFLPNIVNITLPSSILLDNSIVELTINICDFIRTKYCNSCYNLVCLPVSSCFTNNLLYSMDKSKNVDNRIQPTTKFLHYINLLSILFNSYISDIIYKENICKVFIHIVSVNNINFDYCDTCFIHNNVINYFVRRKLIPVLSKENLDSIDIVSKTGITKSRKLLKLKHL